MLNILKGLIIFCFFTSSFEVKAQDWAWIQGSQNVNTLPVWGIKGIASPTNNPGARLGAASWTDNNGNFWLFGGLHGGAYLNDLWMYSLSTKTWTWMKGDNFFGSMGSYGIKGVPAISNNPPRRGFCSTWKDAAGNLWLYGGETIIGASSEFCDLWRYEITTNKWTWMSGSNLSGVQPIYGVKGVADASNMPGDRAGAPAWTDANGDFWLFSGDIQYNDDLWKYTVVTNEWTWVNGNIEAINVNRFGDYGMLGVSAPSNNPSSRVLSTTWVDGNGNFWMFGGYGVRFPIGAARSRNDLWKYDIAANEWTWVHGDTTSNLLGVYGTPTVPDPLNKPGARSFSGSWTDNGGNLWLFGGWSISNSTYYNDLWKYDQTTNEWSWHRGDNFGGGPALYGTQGMASNNNKPNARGVSTFWKDNDGNFWLYGGRQNANAYHDDLWKLSFCPTAIASITPATATICADSSRQLSISGGQSYQWSLNGNAITGAINSTYTATQQGIYTVEIINDACRANAPNSATITIVPQPSVSISPSSSFICANASQLLTTTGNATTYQWSKDGVVIPGAVFSAYNANAAGVYSVTASNGACSTVSNTSSITVKPLPSSSIFPSSAEICEGATQSFTASGADSYQWLFNGVAINGATDSVYNAAQNGNYSVMLYKEGCSAPAANNASLTVRQNPVGVITPSSALICPPATTMLTATGGSGSGSYQWQLNNVAINGATSSTYEAKLPGVYSVIISDGVCSARASNNTVLTTGNAQKGIKYDVLRLIKGQSYQLNARLLGQNFTWMPSTDLSNPFIDNPIITPTANRLYQIKIETPGVCPVNDTLEVQMFLKPDVFVPSAFTPNGDGKNDVLKPIPVQIKSFGSFKVFNRWGQLIYQTKKEGEGWDGTINGKLQPTATYVWLFEGKDADGNNLQLRGTTTLIR